MNLLEELAKLDALRRSGAISDQEFVKAAAALDRKLIVSELVFGVLSLCIPASLAGFAFVGLFYREVPQRDLPFVFLEGAFFGILVTLWWLASDVEKRKRHWNREEFLANYELESIERRVAALEFDAVQKGLSSLEGPQLAQLGSRPYWRLIRVAPQGIILDESRFKLAARGATYAAITAFFAVGLFSGFTPGVYEASDHVTMLFRWDRLFSWSVLCWAAVFALVGGVLGFVMGGIRDRDCDSGIMALAFATAFGAGFVIRLAAFLATGIVAGGYLGNQFGNGNAGALLGGAYGVYKCFTSRKL